MNVERPPAAEAALENLMAEGRSFPPSPAFTAQANATAALYEEAEADYEAFWARLARERIDWMTPFETTLDWQLPFARWFDGGELNISHECLDRNVARGLGDKVAYHFIGEPGRHAHADLCRPAGGGPEGRQRPQGARRRQGRPGRHLHAHDPRAADRDAGLRPSRGAAHRRLRRLLGRGALRAHERCPGSRPDHRRRWLAARQGRRAEGQCRRRRGRRAIGRARPRRPPHRQSGRDDSRPGHLVARDRRSPVRRLPADAGRVRAHALPALHLGHDGQAQGHRPHHRRLPARGQRHPRDGLRHQARGCLLVRGGHRLGDRTQLHRLWPAGQRHDRRHVRGVARHAGLGSLVADHRGLQGHRAVLRADRHPRLHEAGRGAARRARPEQSAAPRLGRRADQPRGLAVVPRAHRWRSRPDRRYLVADRDGHDHDQPRCPA